MSENQIKLNGMDLRNKKDDYIKLDENLTSVIS